MHPRRIVPVLVALLLALLVGAPAASAVVLTDPATRLTVTAPAGYRLTQAKGVYSVSGGGRYAKFMLARTPLSPARVGVATAKGLRGTLSRTTTVKGTWRASLKVGLRGYSLMVRRERGSVLVVLYGTVPRARAAKTARSPRVTAAEILALDRVISSRRGGTTVPLNVPLPTRTFRAPVTNGASAVVPDLPGWQYGGTDTGYLYGGHPTDGVFELGGFTFVNYPGFEQAGQPTANIQQPADTLTNVFPAWKVIHANVQVQFQQVVPVANTSGLLGPGYLSEMYVARFTINGKPWQGLFTIGVMDNAGSFISWGMYYSYIAVPANEQGGVFPALFNTWSTWNNTAASQSRLATALNSVLTTRPPSGGPIDQDVFDEANQKWSEYLRGPAPE